MTDREVEVLQLAQRRAGVSAPLSALLAVYSIWESYFPPEATGEGQEVTERIWEDMRGFAGYLGHELLQDLDDPGHLLVVSRWDTRERADQVLADYAGNPNAVEANRLVDRPRRRFVAAKLPPHQADPRADDAVDDASDGSFPASDAPSTWSREDA